MKYNQKVFISKDELEGYIKTNPMATLNEIASFFNMDVHYHVQYYIKKYNIMYLPKRSGSAGIIPKSKKHYLEWIAHYPESSFKWDSFV